MKRRLNLTNCKQLNHNQALKVQKKSKLKQAHKPRQNRFKMKKKSKKSVFICNFLEQKRQQFFINFLVFFIFQMISFKGHQDSLCFTQKQYTPQLFQYYSKVIICQFSRQQQPQQTAHQ
ncbi:transmembrane protein, putative (macronuclear) [Tetrahymena thermophila SB210]|uniref:Transmembrane protein, putative n=1 Tax=Tetrahymena thermophila (strain SB210) TaxID=312017 RepID=W7XGU0_TETTS|nr:transmembrane protein, putative [Tetrahymena thermophila SB210]EWS76273.1 transmembrane protein, putative [Tetrahymena thermophila SB210]|eukprot:XP_012651191.1 transmembrane protein, putative [Tetrahymena thermophila SB210]